MNPNYPIHVCLLKRSLYGFKQAPHMWNKCLTDVLLPYGFSGSKTDCSLFYFSSGKEKLFCLVYVDDLLLLTSPTLISFLIGRLQSQFVVRDLGRLSYFLRIEASWDSSGLHLSQHKYVNDLLRRTQIDSCTAISTPATAPCRLSATEGNSFHDATIYRSTVGALQYLTFTRPDIAFAVNKVSHFMHNPLDSHWVDVKQTLGYLKGTSSQACILLVNHLLSYMAIVMRIGLVQLTIVSPPVVVLLFLELI